MSRLTCTDTGTYTRTHKQIRTDTSIDRDTDTHVQIHTDMDRDTHTETDTHRHTPRGLDGNVLDEWKVGRSCVDSPGGHFHRILSFLLSGRGYGRDEGSGRQ